MKFFLLIFPLMLVTVSSQARWSDTMPILETDDVALIRETTRVKMNDKPVGTILEWENKKAKSKGSVELLDRFQRNGRECRTNRHRIKPRQGPESMLIITICRTASGSWIWGDARKKFQ